MQIFDCVGWSAPLTSTLFKCQLYINNYNKYKWTKYTTKTDLEVIIDTVLPKCKNGVQKDNLAFLRNLEEWFETEYF